MGDGVFDASLFGTREQVGVVRGLAEIRARRPVLVASNGAKLLVLPTDGIDPGRLSAFMNICSPADPKLIVTARRARALGLEATTPMALTLPIGLSSDTLIELVTNSEVDDTPAAEPAGVAAVAAIQLAKFAQGLPAVLAADATNINLAAFDPALVTVEASAVAHYRRDTIRSLKMVGEARIPLNSGARTRFVAFCDALGENSVAIIVGDPDLSKPMRVRLHSA